MKVFLDNKINMLDIDVTILEKLNDNDINTVKELWILKRKDLKNLNLKDDEINQIIIKLQLYGLDLNKKKYN